MPPATSARPDVDRPSLEDRRYKMRVFDNMYTTDFEPKRFPAGAVIPVDRETALRWMENGIAEPVSATEETHRDIKRRELMAQLEALEANPPKGVYNASLTRGSMDAQPDPNYGVTRRMPPRRGRAAKVALDAAEVFQAPPLPAEAAVGSDDDDGLGSDYP